jgi:hypothetical protein
VSIEFNPPYEPIWEPLKSQTIGNLGLIGIENVLVTFVGRLMEYQRLDTESANDIPDMPMADTEREQTLEGKVRPAVYAGYIPLTVTGEIIPGIVKIPSVTVQALDATWSYQGGSGTVRLLVSTYSQTQNRQGYRDALNVGELIAQELFRAQTIDEQATLASIENSPNPISLRMIPSDELNYFYCLITTVWDLETPTPDFHLSGHDPWIMKPKPAHPLP